MVMVDSGPCILDPSPVPPNRKGAEVAEAGLQAESYP